MCYKFCIICLWTFQPNLIVILISFFMINIPIWVRRCLMNNQRQLCPCYVNVALNCDSKTTVLRFSLHNWPKSPMISQAFVMDMSDTKFVIYFVSIPASPVCQSAVIFWSQSGDVSPTACLIQLCFCFCESVCVVSLNWWPDPVTQIPFHSVWTERKRERQKGVKVRVRESESEGGGGGGRRKPRDICSWVDEHRQSLAHSFLSVM